MALQKLGPFELLKVLGRGGMGTVYEAKEVGHEETVAVKALSPAFSFDEHFRSRFEAEIDALMTLDHKNIVRLFSYGQDEGNLFFAMELVDGCSLFQEQKHGQVFHWREIIDIGIQVCEGLRHAHDRGIIHRDLKPGNLMIDKDRNVKLTDFGIAKSFGGSSLTSEGNVLGTMDFMAPEQARGKGTSVRSDLFSLGAVLYSLLTGRPPFLKKTIEQTFASLLSAEGPDRLDLVAPDVPKPLANLIHRLLEKDPENRIPTAQATGRKLSHVLDMVQNNLAAKETQVVPTDSDKDVDEFETRIVDMATGGHEAQDTSPTGQDSNRSETKAHDKPKFGKRVMPSKASVDTAEFQSRQPDYFNEVTPQQRKKKTEFVAEEEQQSSVWPLVLALIAVLGLAVGGVWYALFRKPNAEELLAAIKARQQTPARVMDEIKSYLKHYPETDDSKMVIELMELGEADQHVNTLRVRRRVGGANLTQIQNKLLDIVDYELRKAPFALNQLNSFLSVYASTENLSSEDSRAIEMAHRLHARIKADSERQIKIDQDHIRERIDSAKSGSDKNAQQILSGLLTIFKKDSAPWTEKLLDEAQAELEKLNDRKKNPKVPDDK